MNIVFPAARCLLAIATLLGLHLSAWAQTAPSERMFRAGAATTNITPPLGEDIVGGWAALPADEVHDELHARALVLDDGTTQLAIVLVDNVGIPAEVFSAAQHRVEETTGIPVAHQLFAATHTHSATAARSAKSLVKSDSLNDYQQFLVTRIADAVRIANKRLAPARIGWGSVEDASELFNRRWYVVEELQRRNPFGGIDQVRMNPSANAALIRPAGPVDPEVSFVSVQHADGRPMCVLGNYSLHYVGGVPARAISADYFAVFAQQIEHLLGAQDQSPPFVAMMSNGTSGDVNNINFAERASSLEPFVKMQIVGEKIARGVQAGLASLEYRDFVELAAATSPLELSVRRPDETLLAYIAEVENRPAGEQPYHQHEKIYAGRVKELAASPTSITVPLQILKIGELGIAAIPFEVFTEIGLEIKAKCPLADCFTIELAGGSFGYLPTPAQHALGGYETWMGTNKVQIDASDRITEQILELFQSLNAKQQ